VLPNVISRIRPPLDWLYIYFMRRFCAFILLTFLVMILISAARPEQRTPVIDESTTKFVAAQFGPGFTVTPPFGQTGAVLFTGDFDGDGIEDAVIIAKTKDPFGKAAELNYKVIDPYDRYFGWGNPRDTARFADHDDHARVLLVIHSWHAPVPKAKFVIINVPFDSVSVGSVSLKKKPRSAIGISEQDSIESYLFWDDKKWRYTPGPME
jgi:hypothetical protein